MELQEIKELLKAFDDSSSAYLEIEQDGTKIKIKKPEEKVIMAPPMQGMPPIGPPPQPMAPVQERQTVQPEGAEPEVQDGQQVLAPLVGVFYAAPSPEEVAYVQVGDSVKEGQVLCLIEAMKMMSEITAPCDGVIKQIYVKNQDVVEFDQPLFLIGD